MSEKHIVVITDDVNGVPFALGEGEVDFRIRLGDEEREIDLTNENLQVLLDAIQPFWDAARPVAGGKTKPRPRKYSAAVIREWALAKGYQLSTHGRIPNEVDEAFNKAQTAQPRRKSRTK